MQAYVEAEGDCEERGISHLPVHEVHKIALLDMRLGNCDRNGGKPCCWTAPLLTTSGTMISTTVIPVMRVSTRHVSGQYVYDRTWQV